jgi:hypothetical protein
MVESGADPDLRAIIGDITVASTPQGTTGRTPVDEGRSTGVGDALPSYKERELPLGTPYQGWLSS